LTILVDAIGEGAIFSLGSAIYDICICKRSHAGRRDGMNEELNEFNHRVRRDTSSASESTTPRAPILRPSPIIYKPTATKLQKF
jgi:hypothetical protein